MRDLPLPLEDGSSDMAARKRRYGRGSVRERNGTWYIRFRPQAGAKQIEERVGRTADGVDREAAEHVLLERLVVIGRGEGAQFEGHLFEDAITGWRAWDRSINAPSQRTQDLDDNIIECHLLPAFAGMYLHQLGFREIEAYLTNKLTYLPSDPQAAPVAGDRAERRKKPLSRRYLEMHLTILSKIFKWAVREGRAIQDPVPLVSWRQVRANKRATNKPEPLEREQVEALLRYSRDEERELKILVMAKLGLRLGELLSLYVGDYVAKSSTLRVRRTLTREGGRTIIGDYAKTEAGHRELVVSEELGMRIERQIARVKRRPAHAGGKRLLFSNTVGNIHGPDNYRDRDWQQTLNAYELAVDEGRADDVEFEGAITPHRLRHTAASEWIMAGKPDTLIAYWLGHKSAAITRQVYAHVFRRAQREVADLPDLYSHEVAA